jgi:4-hydroxybenzoate polyprenyltransferase
MMRSGIIEFIFFANYFVGLLGVALSVETVFQLDLPLASPVYYILLFSTTVMYYTYAYSGATVTVTPSNPRTEWYRLHHSFIHRSQTILFTIWLACAAFLFYQHHEAILRLPLYYWFLIVPIPFAGLLYYGLLPSTFNLRNTGWFKAFVIGFVWAGCVNFLPVTMAKIEYGISVAQPDFMLWLFIKNWMFCTVNAIMFDIKDYEDDANKQLKTFVVRFGLRNTIFFILIPLLFIGIVSLLIFTYYKNFSALVIGVNLLPFLSLLYVAYSLQRPKKILYYLIVIDGLLLVKAVCGISGIVLLKVFP